MLFPLCFLKCLLLGRDQWFTKFAPVPAWMGVLWEGPCAEVVSVSAVLSWALPSLKYFWFYFVDLNIILIYPHISSDTSTYWSFRHLQACGCLISSPLVWFDYLTLSPFFSPLRKLRGSDDGSKSHHSFTTTPSLSASLCFFPYSPSGPPPECLHCKDRGQADGAEDKRRKEMWVLGFCMGWPTSLALNLCVNLFWQLRQGLRNLVFLKERNEQSPDLKSEETLKITRKAVTAEQLSCLGLSCGLKFHFIFITYRTRIIAPGRAVSRVPLGLPEHPKQ